MKKASSHNVTSIMSSLWGKATMNPSSTPGLTIVALGQGELLVFSIYTHPEHSWSSACRGWSEVPCCSRWALDPRTYRFIFCFFGFPPIFLSRPLSGSLLDGVESTCISQKEASDPLHLELFHRPFCSARSQWLRLLLRQLLVEVSIMFA